MPTTKSKQKVAKSKDKKKGAKKKKPVVVERKVVYEKRGAVICDGEKSLTVAKAKSMLGWTEETENVKFGADYMIKDIEGVKIRCLNNINNRPIRNSVLATLQQEILRGNWKYNGTTMGLGKTGMIVDGQHTLISLILAGQEWEKHPGKWKPYWKTEPTIEKLIATGVDESDEVINTIDTCTQRDLTDVLYRSAYFASAAPNERKKLARMANYAIRQLQHRTGANLNAYAPLRTHAESVNFLDCHPKLQDAVEHIHAENTDAIGELLSTGAAAGLLYLMAASKTDPSKYQSAVDPNEKLLDLSLWEKACDFWTELAGGADKLVAVKQAITKMYNDEHEGASKAQREAVLVKAWLLYLRGKPITAKDLRLQYQTDEDGWKTLSECPIMGGIDVGGPDKVNDGVIGVQDGQEDLNATVQSDKPSSQEIAERIEVGKKAKAKKEKAKEAETEPEPAPTKKRKPGGKLKPKSQPGKPRVGGLYWVVEKDKESWRGRIVEISKTTAKLKVQTGHQGAGNVVTASLGCLRAKQPSS